MKFFKYKGDIALTIITVCLPSLLHAQGLRINPGACMVASGTPNLVLNNAGLVNNGNLDADSSTVIFTGEAGAQGSFIGGENQVSFYNLMLSKTFNDVELNNSIMIRGRIIMNGGNLRLNNYTLDLGSSGVIQGESNKSFITGMEGGVIKVNALLDAPHAVDPGNIGVEISSDNNLGWTVISRGHVVSNSSDAQNSIQRWFDFAPAANAGLHATLRLFYLDGELAGNDKDQLNVFSSSGESGRWQISGKDKGDPSANWVMKDNIDQLHRFTLGIQKNETLTSLEATAFPQVYPNPSHEALTLVLFSEKISKVKVSLYDASGHLLEQKEVYCQAGLNNIRWDMGRYAAGIYFMSRGDKGAGNIRIIKQ